MIGADSPRSPAETEAGSRFSDELLYSAAALYYLGDANQAEIAERLGTSRPTVSRLLSEARRRGIVRIDVMPPAVANEARLSSQLAKALGLDAVYLVATAPPGLGWPSLATGVVRALAESELTSGDVMLVSSGRTIYEVSRADLPAMPGTVVVPMIGGQDEPEPWYQSNEIARHLAAKIGGRPQFLYAPALPGEALHRTLLKEPSIRRILEFWTAARCAVVGVGAPPLSRQSIPGFVPTDAVSMRRAVGDVCSRFYDRDGKEVPFPGSERLVATDLEVLRQIPVTIGVAVGPEKAVSIETAARAGLLNRLVTDTETAVALLASGASSARKRKSPPTKRQPTPAAPRAVRARRGSADD